MLTFIERTEQIVLNSSQRMQNINHNLFSAFRSQTSNSTFNREKMTLCFSSLNLILILLSIFPVSWENILPENIYIQRLK